MFGEIEFWSEVHRCVLTVELPKRSAYRKYDICSRTLEKMLAHAEPPVYGMQKPRMKRKLETFLPITREILKADKQAPKRQRHTATKIDWSSQRGTSARMTV